MVSQTNILLKSNSIVILKTLESMATLIRETQEATNTSRVSVIYISCEGFSTKSTESATVGLIHDLLEQIMYRTRVGCPNIFLWLKYREVNEKFGDMVKQISETMSIEDIKVFLSHNHSIIKEQLQNLIDIEKRDLPILVITDFHNVTTDYQPLVAGLIHKLSKGTPMYFKILSVGEPIVFKKDATGEVGIQRGHDYVEIQVN